MVPGDTDGGNSTGEIAAETPTPIPTEVTQDQPEFVATPDTFGEESVASGDVSDSGGSVEVAAEPVQVTITVWICDVDPGALDPATTGSCSPDADVQLTPTADGVDLGVLTTAVDGQVLSLSSQGRRFGSLKIGRQSKLATLLAVPVSSIL